MSDPSFATTFIAGMATASILWMGVFAWAFMRAPRRKDIPAPRAETYVLNGSASSGDDRWRLLKEKARRNRVTKAFGEDV